MDFQHTIQKLESIKEKALNIEQNTAYFYQQWQQGVSMGMKGNLEVDTDKHTSAYIEGLLDAIAFLETQYFDRIYRNLTPIRDRKAQKIG